MGKTEQKKSLSLLLNDDFIDAVADRVIEKNKIKEAEKNEVKEKPSIYTVKDVVSITKLSNLTIRNHINSGLLKAKKVGKAFRIKEADLNKYLTK